MSGLSLASAPALRRFLEALGQHEGGLLTLILRAYVDLCQGTRASGSTGGVLARVRAMCLTLDAAEQRARALHVPPRLARWRVCRTCSLLETDELRRLALPAAAAKAAAADATVPPSVEEKGEAGGRCAACTAAGKLVDEHSFQRDAFLLALPRAGGKTQARTLGLLGCAAKQADYGSFVESWHTSRVDFQAAVDAQPLRAHLHAAEHIRKQLSVVHAPIGLVVASGAVPRLVDLLGLQSQPEAFVPKGLLLEVAWALTNVASGTHDHTAAVTAAGGVPPMIKLAGNPDPDLVEQACWALGNIAGDCVSSRDLVLAAGGLAPILAATTMEGARVSIVRNAVWALSNLCRGRAPKPDFKAVATALPTLARLVAAPGQDEEVLVDACWALSYLSDGGSADIQGCVDTPGVVASLADHCDHATAAIACPALRALGNVATGDSAQTQHIIDNGVLPKLAKLLQHDKATMRKEACWVLSNVAAGSVAQIQALVDTDGVVPRVVGLLAQGDTANAAARKEAAWVVANCVSGHSASIAKFVEHGCLPALCAAVGAEATVGGRVVEVALDTLATIFHAGAPAGPQDAGARADADADADAAAVAQLVTMGFPADQCRAAVRTVHVHTRARPGPKLLETAVNLLLDPAAELVDGADGVRSPNTTSASDAAGAPAHINKYAALVDEAALCIILTAARSDGDGASASGVAGKAVALVKAYFPHAHAHAGAGAGADVAMATINATATPRHDVAEQQTSPAEHDTAAPDAGQAAVELQPLAMALVVV